MVQVVKMDISVLIDHGLWLYLGMVSCLPDQVLLFVLEVLWQSQSYMSKWQNHNQNQFCREAMGYPTQLVCGYL